MEGGAGPRRSCRLSCDPVEARRQVRTLLDAAGWDGDRDGVVLAVHEAMRNAEDHGGGSTHAVIAADGSVVVVEVGDRGPGFDIDHHTRRRPDPAAERGRGVWLIGQFASSWRIDRLAGGTCLRLVFRL